MGQMKGLRDVEYYFLASQSVMQKVAADCLLLLNVKNLACEMRKILKVWKLSRKSMPLWDHNLNVWERLRKKNVCERSTYTTRKNNGAMVILLGSNLITAI